MPNLQAEEFYEKGLHALSNGHVYLALVCFEQAANLEKSSLYSSYLAFCIAKARGQYREAMDLCAEVIVEEPANHIHYLNLGRIHLLAGEREKALRALRDGLQHDKNSEILRELERLGLRKPPVFNWLKREHPLNKYCGILLKKLGLR